MKMPLSRGISMLSKVRYEREADIEISVKMASLSCHFKWWKLVDNKGKYNLIYNLVLNDCIVFDFYLYHKK